MRRLHGFRRGRPYTAANEHVPEVFGLRGHGLVGGVALLISHGRGRRRRHARVGGWFVRRSPDDTAGVLSPPATMAVALALMLVVALSIRTIKDDAGGTRPTEPSAPAAAGP